MILDNHIATCKQQAAMWLESAAGAGNSNCHGSNLGGTESDFSTHCKRSAQTQISQPHLGQFPDPIVT